MLKAIAQELDLSGLRKLSALSASVRAQAQGRRLGVERDAWGHGGRSPAASRW